MSVISLGETDLDFMRENYPLLSYMPERNRIVGVIELNSKFRGNVLIKGEKYRIEIILVVPSNEILPKVKDVDCKIQKIAIRKCANPLDFHVVTNIPKYRMLISNSDLVYNYLCLIHPTKIKNAYPNGFNFPQFLYHLEEHLYWVTYYDRYGKKPWDDEPHN